MINNTINNRVKQIDILRISAALLVLTYHVWVYSGYPPTGYHNIIAYGGEIGVTLFFIISGFSIYLSIESMFEKDGGFNYKEFIIKRSIRILPAYYICMFIIIIFSNNGYLNSSSSIMDILLHIFLVHNVLPSTHGSINGVFWTLGNIFQFYLIAIILYKLIKRYKVGAVAVSIGLTIIYKIMIFNYLQDQQADGVLYFIYGRQLMGTLDNFVIGMFLAYLYKKKNNIQVMIKGMDWLKILGLSLLLYIVIDQLNKNALYDNTVLGYTWHSIIACILGTLIYFMFKIPVKDSKVLESLLALAKLEYPIYLWHLPILIQISQISKISELEAGMKFNFILGITLLVTLIWCYIYNETICKNSYMLYSNMKRLINRRKILIGCMALFFILSMNDYGNLLKEIKSNLKYLVSDTKVEHDNLAKLVQHVDKVIALDNNLTYIYLDYPDYEGTMNFYRNRYYLAPRRAINWNTYAFNLDLNDKEAVANYLNSIEVDYVIMRNCPAIETAFGLEGNREQGYLFKKNPDNDGTLEQILIRIGE